MARGALTIRASLAALLLASASLALAAPNDPFEAMNAERVVPPRPAPDVAFTSIDGREVRLHDLRGNVVLLGFFTTT